MTTITQSITALPTAPARTQDPATFIVNADAFVAALTTMVTQENTWAGQVNTVAGEVNDNAVAAAASEAAAVAAQSAAESASNAALWVSGQSYVTGDAAISTVDLQTYRANTSTSGTTDPSASGDWDIVGGATLGANTFTGQQTFAEVKDTVYTITDGAAFEIDPVNGSVQTVTLGASRTPAATNFEAGQTVLLGIDDGTAYSITWSTVNPTWVKSGGGASAPTLATTGWTWVLLWKTGSTMYAAEVGKP